MTLFKSLPDSAYVTPIAFTPDGKVFVGRHSASEVLFWDISTGKILKHLSVDLSADTFRVLLSPDGKLLAGIGRHNKTAILWDVATGKELRTLQLNFEFGADLAFSPDSRQIATVNVNEVVLWDVVTGKKIWTWKWPKEFSKTFTFRSPDGNGKIPVVGYSFHIAFSPNGNILE